MTTTLDGMTLQPDTERRLQKIAKRLDDTIEKRDRAIVEAHISGAAYREIARAIGMSHVGVRDIVRRYDDLIITDDQGNRFLVEVKTADHVKPHREAEFDDENVVARTEGSDEQ